MNHPNRGARTSDHANPLPNVIRATRERAGLTVDEAASRILGSVKAWKDWEAGASRMHPGLWRLFLIEVATLQQQDPLSAATARVIAGVRAGRPRSISDDDVCSSCRNCFPIQGELALSGCTKGWPYNRVDEDGYIVGCHQLDRTEPG